MSEISRTALFSKLNKLAYKSIESATVFCKMRGNPYVEIEHWLQQILQQPDCDLQHILRHFDCNSAHIASDLSEALDKLPRGATSISDFSTHVEDSIERAWVYASLLFNHREIRTGHWLLGMIHTRSLMQNLQRISKEFERIKYDDLSEHFDHILEGSAEATLSARGDANAEPGVASSAMAPAAMQQGEALKTYTINLSEQAKSGEVDPIVGRDDEIRQIIDILMRRRQNNPILTGEAGVGKTAVVEGFAQRIAKGEVPSPLKNVELLSLDIGLLQAGASMKGEFEERLKQIIEEVHASETPIILFIDEAHRLIGAGGAAGTGDAANLLKPELARGTLRTIAATTWSEYKKHIEKDPALTRRFQVIQVPEPDEAKAVQMMRALVKTLEQHHQVQILDEAVVAAVKLSHRYIPARQLPDKSVSLLDTACARVAISQSAEPASLENVMRQVQALNIELDIVKRELKAGENSQENLNQLQQQLEQASTEQQTLEEKWQTEKSLINKIIELRAQLQNSEQEGDDNSGKEGAQDSPANIEQLHSLRAELAEVQGESPLLSWRVDEQSVAAVVQDWTGIPVGRMVKDEIATLISMAELLGRRIIGQRHALESISKRIQTSRAGLDNPDKPVGVFLLAGTSGVGKTETALALAELLYGGDHNVITINMSEYQEAHTVSSLKGAPPGYVGYGEGGVLTEAVRRRPYSVVLLDEVEKAHPDVHEIFFQVFDKGWMEDGEGRRIDFKNTLIILTTNVGTQTITQLCQSTIPSAEQLNKELRAPLLKVFPAALLGRLVTVPYFPLSGEDLKAIIRLQLGRIERRLQVSHNILLQYDNEVVELILQRCTELESGGRMIDAILTNTVLPEISKVFLQRMAEADMPKTVKLSAQDDNFTYAFA